MKGVLADTNRLTITYTDTTPTVAELYSKIADASQQIYANVFLPATHVVMHPRRWAWITAAADTTGRPLVSPVAGQNSPGQFGVTAEGVVGTLQGLQVVIDPSLPVADGAGTNEDKILVTRAQENILYELPTPNFRVFEEILSGTLGVRLQLFGYAAFSTERRSKANASIGGSGCAAPTF